MKDACRLGLGGFLLLFALVFAAAVVVTTAVVLKNTFLLDNQNLCSTTTTTTACGVCRDSRDSLSWACECVHVVLLFVVLSR